MNAKTMAVVLDRTEQSTRAITDLKRMLQESRDSFMRLQALVGCGHLDKEQTEEAIKNIRSEMASLKENERDRYHIVGALDDITILPRQQGESYGAYIMRLGQCIVTSDSMREDLARLADSRFSELAELHVKHTKLEDALGKRDTQIAQFEEAASSLASALTLLGTMHDGELANEFVSRMAEEKKRVTLQLDLIAKVIEQLPDSMRMQHGETYEPFSRRIQNSYVANEATIARHEATIESLKNRDAELLALYDVIENLRGLPMQPEEKYSEYLKRMAADRMRLVEKLAGSFTAGYVSTLIRERDDAHYATEKVRNERDEARADVDKATLQTVHNLEGELSLHQQVIARLMMQPGTDKVFDLDWNASARKVLIDARAMCGDTAEANVVSREPA